MKKCFLFVCSFIFYNVLFCQGPIITTLQKNQQLIHQSKVTSSKKRAITDTLKLGFMDDFTSTNVYPDTRIWMDKQVYINSHFPISPPSYGVATFDNLNEKGVPYRPLSGNTHGASDTLTSNPINLKNYIKLSVVTNYSIADSIYLSFFYQAQGLGDILDNSDSLVLKFKKSDGTWKTVWKQTGSGVKPFKQVLVGILSNDYLYSGFQFRFINFTKNTGNMNQWHLDYVRMNLGRNRHDTLIAEVAINKIPIGPLKFYESMPYNHFKVNPNFHVLDSVILTIRNNTFETSPINVGFGYTAYNKYNSIIKNIPFGAVNENVNSQIDFSRKLISPSLDTFSSKSPQISVKYKINLLSNDITTSEYNNLGNNNEYTKTTKFENYFAHDDGTAEGGFGLDYASLPNGPGYVAIKHQLDKADTLRGLSIFFNRSIADVQYKYFELKIWKSISEPPSPNPNDVTIYTLPLNTTIYKDSINGFVDFIFDTILPMTAGTYYVGWKQNNNFMLNVGYDNNYLYAKSGGKNPNIFYNLLGYWESVSANVTGAVMIRPIVGAKIKTLTNIEKTITQDIDITIYPNPIAENDILKIESETEFKTIKLIDITGKTVFETNENTHEIPVKHLQSGLYIIQITDYNNHVFSKKIIKN